MTEPFKVVQASREVIERKLLTAVSDEAVVAILATKDDLDMLIEHLQTSSRGQEFAQGLAQLRREAFEANPSEGTNQGVSP